MPFDHGCGAAREETREQHAGLDLRACDRKLVVRAAKRGPCDVERRQTAFATLDAGSHPAQRLGDSIDWTAADAFVTVERPFRTVLSREPTRKQAE
jgi:hypothetical protein